MYSHAITVIPNLTPNVLHLLSSRAGTGAAIVGIGVVVLVLVLVGSHTRLVVMARPCVSCRAGVDSSRHGICHWHLVVVVIQVWS